LKFLVPLSLLVSAGSYLPLSRAPGIVQSNLSFIESFSLPIVSPASLSLAKPALTRTVPVHSSVIPRLLFATWFLGFAVIALSQYLRRRHLRALIDEARFLDDGREIEALQRVQTRRGSRESIYLASSLSALEPGVHGVLTHLLLLPADISQRLDDAQLEAVLAHEVAHIERRDNLFASVHMMVEMLFWFHPLVWWIGSRMVEERERACDGDVLRSGGDAAAYAGAILKVCQYYLSSPLTTVSGISGSNLRKRIEDIMANHTGEKLDVARKVLLATAGIAIAAAPILAGAMYAAQTPARQSNSSKLAFEVASVKVNKSGDRAFAGQYLPVSHHRCVQHVGTTRRPESRL
jgi:bla regulator protein blaR1